MPDPLSAKDSRSSLGKTVSLWLLETVAAFVTAWLLAAGFCFLSAELGLRLPSFTCGRTFGMAFMICFATFWPMFAFVLPLLVPKLAVRLGQTPVTRFQLSFLALVVTQAAHSIEEYVGRLYEVFPPARAVSGLISADLERGFVIFNVALFTFGVWCFLWPVRGHWPSAVPLAWFWVVIELINGIGHPLWTLAEWKYTPGVATAPLLLSLAVYLAGQLLRGPLVSSPPNNRCRGP